MIGTDRPTLGPAADLVPAGSLQMESGAGASVHNSQYVVDLPESLIRFGVARHAEIRFRAASAVYQPHSTDGRYQASDVELSTKILLARENSIAPKSGILAVTFPTGGPSITTGSYDPALTLIWTQAAHSGFFVNEVAQAALTTQDDARRATYAPSIASGWIIHERVVPYAEFAPTLLTDHSVVYAADGGLLFLHNKVHQFDVHGGYIRDADGIHALLGVGYSMRIDHFLGRKAGPLSEVK